MQWIILFAVLSTGAVIRRSIVIPPGNVIGKVGGTAVFKCKVDFSEYNEMDWIFNGKKIYSYLHANENYFLGRERYSVTQDGRTFELSIKDLQYSDGGEYACEVPNQVSAAHLVVIGPPNLSFSTIKKHPVAGTMAKFICTAEFGGPSKDDIPPGQYPKLQMFLGSTPLDDTFKEEHLEGATSSYKLTQIHYTILKPNMDGKSLMCKTETSQPDVHETVMTKIIVMYSVRNIRYTPEGHEHKIGTTIDCTADGNPQPDFIWTDTRNKANILHGPSLQITEEMVGSNAWRCNATNTISGSICEETLLAEFQAGVAPLGSIVIPLEDVTGKVGETAVFKCEVDLKDHKEMVWTFNGKTIYSFLYGKEKYPLGREKYSVTQDGSTSELSVKDLQYSDGGEYRCDVPSQVSAAHLVIIGPLQLSYSTVTPYQVEGTTAKFVCKVEFGGPSKDDIPPGQYPKMQMFLGGTLLDDTYKEENLEVATSSYNLTQIHYMTLKSNMDGKSLMCKTETIRPAMNETVMNKMIVLYSVRDIRYTPDGDEHKFGTTIKCTADGNPQPNFIWTDTKNKTNVIHGPSLRITEEMVGSNAWRCNATNNINGSIHNETLVAVFHAGVASLGSIVIPLEDVTDKVGDTAVFRCEVDLKDYQEMVWTFNGKAIYSFLSGKEKYPLGRKKYSVTQDGRTSELSVKDLQYSDGGEYRCDVPSQVSAAHLVVIGPLQLSYLTVTPYQVEGTTAKFVCKVEFGGPSKDDISPGQFPKLQMFLGGTLLDDTYKEENLEVATSSYNLTQIHYMTLKSSMDGKSLMCKTETIRPAMNETVMIKMIVLYSWKLPVGLIVLSGLVIGCLTAVYVKRKEISEMTNIRPWKNEVDLEMVPTDESELLLLDSEDLSMRAVIDPRRRNNYHFQLNDVGLQVPPKSVEDQVEITVTQRDTAQKRQKQIESKGLDDVLKPLMQLSLHPFGLKLAEPAEMRIHTNCMHKSDYIMIFNKDDNYQWIDITNECNIYITENGIVFSVRRFSDMQIFLCASSSSTDPETASNFASEVLNDKNIVLQVKAKSRHTASYEEFMEIINGHNHGKDLDTATAKKIAKLLSDLKINFPIGGPAVTEVFANKYATKKEDPLLCLVELLENDITSMIIQHPEVLLELVKELLQLDTSTMTRSRCVRALIMNTKEWKLCQGEQIPEADPSSGIKQLHWSSRFIEVLKILQENGADPAWSPENSLDGSNLHLFVSVVKYIISYESSISKNVIDTLESMMTESSLSCTNVDGQGRTILHILVDRAKGPLLPDSLGQLTKIVSKVKSINADLLDVTDKHAHTPLHSFVMSIFVHCVKNKGENERRKNDEAGKKRNVEKVSELAHQWINNSDEVLRVISSLKSENNMNFQAKDGDTPLHVVAAAAIEWKDNPEKVLKILQCLKSKTNLNKKSESGHTPLMKFTISTSQWADHPDAFLEIVNCLRSNVSIDTVNNLGQIALHAITLAATEWVGHPEKFLNVVQCLKTAYNIDIKTKDGNTALHHMAHAARAWKDQPDAFLAAVRQLKSPNNVEFKTESSHTPLMLFVRAAKQWAHRPSQFLEVVKHLKSDTNINTASKSGDTALHYFACAAAEWAGNQEIFFKVVKCLKSNSNIDLKAMNGDSAFHVFIQHATKWEDQSMYSKVDKCLTSHT